ncbi:MAG TPA: hypothetical protein DD621_02470 [Clostridiales bacterium]|nr:hypothetical protein [Clostridiales bacterium]
MLKCLIFDRLAKVSKKKESVMATENIDDKEDLRVVRTRLLLSKALYELLETTPFEKISVMDICNKAMVHRATFYNHFYDKEDLLEFSIDQVKESLFKATIEKEKYNSPKEMYMSLISAVIDFVDANKKQFLIMLNINNYNSVTGLLLTTIKRSLRYLTSKNEYKENYTLPVNVIIDFISGGATNLGLNWLRSSNPCSKEELLSYFDILLNDKIYIK